MDSINTKNLFKNGNVNKGLLLTNIIMSIIYFYIIAFYFTKDNLILFSLLIIGEVFHLWQILTYVYTIWNTEKTFPFNSMFEPSVDIFITVAGEPIEIVKETILACKNIDYPNFKIFILNDSFVAKKDNWEEYELLAHRFGVNCITRRIPGGAKAGNINNALRQTDGEFVIVFDADHVPHSDFIRKTIGYAADEKVAFIQTPQYYKNHNMNDITGGSWEQQSLFFGPILKGKNRLNSVFMCGTNMVLRRVAIEQVGGMCETNIAEDFLTSLFIHEKGWKSIYVPEVLAEGLAPEDFLSYYKQQFRWSRGSLEVIFKYNPLFRRGLKWRQKIQYLASASYYLSGSVVLMNALLPLAYFYTGLVPISTSTMALATIFIPYILINLYTLQASCNWSFSFRAIAFSLGSFFIHIKAIFFVIFNIKTAFSVTSKTKINGKFLNLVIPQLIYIALAIGGIIYSYIREGVNASFMTNFAWILLNIILFMPFIIVAMNFSLTKEEPIALHSHEPNSHL